MLTFNEIKNQSMGLYPAVLLDKILPYRARKFIQRLSFVAFIIILLVMIVVGFPEKMSPESFQIRGAFFMIFVFFVMTYLIEWFYLSFYVREYKIDFEVAYLLLTSDGTDLSKDFLKSEIGMMIMKRLNISPALVKGFIKSKNRVKISSRDVSFTETNKGTISLLAYLNSIYSRDKSFADFLSNHFIDARMFLEASQWSDEILYIMRHLRLFLSRDKLERIPSIGKNWSYRRRQYLQKYAHIISESPIYKSLGTEWRIYRNEAEKVENVLVEEDGQNVMMVVSNIDSGIEILSALGKIIMKGYALYKIEGKEIWVVDFHKFIKDSIHKENFEANLKNILIEAHNTANVILVFPRFSNFTEKAYNLEVDVENIFREFLASSDIHIVAIVEENEFYQSVETRIDLMKSFAKIVMRDSNLHTLDRVLKTEIRALERENGVFFTYKAFRRARNLFEGSTLVGANVKKIAAFLQKLATLAKNESKGLVTERIVERAV